MIDDITKRLEKLTTKSKELETKKIRAEQEVSLLKKQYDELLIELKQAGIEDVNNLPNLIDQLEEEFNRKLSKGESDIEQIEKNLASLQ